MPRGNGDPQSSNGSKIFIDADAFIALAVEEDLIRSWAESTSKLLRKFSTPLLTSNFVYGEVVTLVSQKLGLKRAKETVELIESMSLVIEAEIEHRRMATQKFFAQSSKNARFTDYINIAIMDDLGIDTIFSHDIHYKQAGYKRLGVDITKL